MAKRTKTRAERTSRDASLRREQAVFDASLVEWLSDHAGKYVLIKGSEVGGFYESRDQALSAGYARFGFGPLLVKQVLRAEPALAVDYVAVVDPYTFTEVQPGQAGPAVIVAAATAGRTRLIDNVPVVLGATADRRNTEGHARNAADH